MPEALVGSAAARAIHGWSTGVELVWLGRADRANEAPTPTSPVQASPVQASPVQASPVQASTVQASTVQASTVQALATLGLAAAPAPTADCASQLFRLATLAAAAEGPLVVVADDLALELPALLDLLDVPGDRTGTLVADPRTVSGGDLETAFVRVSADGSTIESVRTDLHRCLDPNRLSVGILRLAAADCTRAAELWQRAASFSWQHSDPFAAALLTLVRGGVNVAAVDCGCYAWGRTSRQAAGTAGTAWQQRLRNASRGGDGPYSTLAVRPLSRRMDVAALQINASPNLLTMISLMIGLGTAALVWTGLPVAWIVAAFTLQLALLVDCMDGEIARFTRRFSTLGAWLDGVGDRVKEYAVFAALGAVAVRQGHSSGWLLALIAMVVVTARHLEDYAYADRTARARSASPEIGPLTEPGARSGTDPARTRLPASRTRSARVVFWLKKLAHVPIAERYLILSLALFTLHPTWVLGAAIAVSAFALVWTSGGRLLKVVLGRDRLWTATPPTQVTLDDQLDLGILARLAGKAFRIPFLLGTAAAVTLWLGAVAASCLDHSSLAVGLAVVAAVTVGAAARRPLYQRLGWLLLPSLWVVEAAVWGSLMAHHLVGAAVFVVVAVVAYRRYDLIYSIRLNGARLNGARLKRDRLKRDRLNGARLKRDRLKRDRLKRDRLNATVPSAWSVVLGLGTEGRILVATLFSLLVADRATSTALLAAAGYLLVVALAESVRVRRLG